MSDSYKDLGAIVQFPALPDWADGIPVDLFTGRDIIAYNNGVISIRQLTLDRCLFLEYNFANMTKADEYALLKFFLDRKGRCERFWLPMWFNEFELLNSIQIGDSNVSVKINGFPSVLGPGAHPRIFIKLKNGDVITRGVYASDIEGGEQFLYLMSAFDRDIAQEEIDCFGRYLLVRFDQDELVLAHTTPALSDCSIRFKELPKEYVFADVIES